jgi:uncharacterized 2Fe-2S/4Fe-4S cluster protein (DUF4445 family)
MEALQRAALSDTTFYTPCGGKGRCGRCRIRIIEGLTSPPTDDERRCLGEEGLIAGIRLACQTRPRGPLQVEVDAAASPKGHLLQVEGTVPRVTPDPAVSRHVVALDALNSDRSTPLWKQIKTYLSEARGLHGSRLDPALARALPASLQAGAITFTLREGEVINARPGNTSPHPMGLAVDLGTTKIACFVVDLATGATLAQEGIVNPQALYGEDIMSRLTYALKSTDQRDHLVRVAVDAINRCVGAMASSLRIDQSDIEEVIVAGNTAMHHILLRQPILKLVRAPYQPAITGPVELKARDVGLRTAPGAIVHFIPPVAGYVGGDHVAMIMGSGIHTARGVILGIDIGTNTEIVLSVDGDLTSCSCPSGPAFEGAHIYQGMAATDGAICEIELDADGHTSLWKTIGDRPPAGLCGSGVLDAMAELVRHNIVNIRGVLERRHPRVKECARYPYLGFVLIPAREAGLMEDIILTQRDIGEIQLAKGAIASGIDILLKSAGVEKDDISKVIIAGAFGSHLRLKSAVTIGLLPDLPEDRFRQVGNAAGAGARLALISMTYRRMAADMAKRIKYVELAAMPEFSASFARSLRFHRADG